MAFCRFCGKELGEGEVCSCQTAAPAAEEIKTEAVSAQEATKAENEAPAQEAPKTTVNIPVPDKAQVTGLVKNIWKSFLNIFMRPATEGKAFVENAEIPVSACFMVLQAILSSLFGCVLIGKINKLFDMGFGFLDSYKFSGVKAFFLTFLFSIIFSLLLMLLFWLASLILKLNRGLKQTMALAAVRSVALIPFIILSIVLALLNPAVGIAVFYGSILLALCFLLEAVKGYGEMKADRALYTVFIVIFVFALACILIGSKVIMLYVPDSIRDLREIGSLTDFLF